MHQKLEETSLAEVDEKLNVEFIDNMQVHDSPLKVAVEHLRDQPYNPSEDHLKATTLEIVSTLKELLHLHPLYNEQLRSFAGLHGSSTCGLNA